MSLLQVRNTSISCLFTRRDIFPKNSNGTVISFLVERSFSFFLFINNNNNNNNNNDEQMTVNDEGAQNKSEHKCCENKETMQKDTKLENPRERRCRRILDQEPKQYTRTCFLTNE